MSELRAEDVNLVLSRLSKDVRALLKTGEVWLAGGFIRSVISGNERPTDIDLFGHSKESLKLIALEFSAKLGAKVHETDNAITLLAPPRLPVQFITRWTYDDPKEIIRSFDFTVCQAAIWFNAKEERDLVKTWRSRCSDRFYSDLAARRLYYTSPVREEAAGGSMLRVRKFLSRGYNIQPYSLAGVVARLISGIDMNRPGMEEEGSVTRVVAGLLQEVDPLVVVDGVEFGEEDHVRNFRTELVEEGLDLGEADMSSGAFAVAELSPVEGDRAKRDEDVD